MRKLINYVFSGFILLISCSIITGCATSNRKSPAPIVNVTKPTAETTNELLFNSSNVTNMPSLGQTTPIQSPTSATVLQSMDKNKQLVIMDAPLVSKTPANASGQVSSIKNKENSVTQNTNTEVKDVEWIMPVSAKLYKPFSVSLKGVEFTANIGQPIYAVNDGRVLYSGNGLSGYGNLIIIKHANNYLSAYSHNQSNLVREGETILRGQKIATMGADKDKQPLLHFELRKNGKPINPFLLIKNN